MDAYRASGDETKNTIRESITGDENRASHLAPQWGRVQIPPPMNAANLSRTSLGRALLSAACLCRNPIASRFYLGALMRNLRESCHHRAHRPGVHEKIRLKN